MKLIVGLGNPGKQYEKTRHNVGFMVLDELQKTLQPCGANAWELSKKFNAQICTAQYQHEKIILVKPMTFMNASGQTVGLLTNFYKLSARDMIIIHDEKDLPLGEIKLQTGRGHAGHNGVKSIIELLGGKDFSRIRVGIASKDKNRMDDTVEFVLGKFALLEKRPLKHTIQTAAALSLQWATT